MLSLVLVLLRKSTSINANNNVVFAKKDVFFALYKDFFYFCFLQ